ncbi:hypothetical protein MEE_00311 [Bartonella elizabethae F9251 = ATCC 49927]|uniref:Trimeric autotransporter adhesin YadA-like C-terminal membrane anchor domain-containing protein n=1 Tax=Bartonella elizabethae F9251 = ATCC 49927 TaxID=1094555 RepID=J1KGR5_BAREL|nr:Vomp family autotransporter [Bartonella elizabethae]EJF96770.1 hypothetical protein MEE_00311 [Bartonella elizabethae F9251 = ATCC 49927]VEJ39529.1 Adhesin yadA precursor [Bartonella elizabethae]
MKKKYSTPNLIKAVSLSAAMATLLSSVSPVFAANLAITGANNLSTNLGGVSYAHGSHGSVVLSGDDDYCGADNVIGRGGKQQKGITDSQRISAEDQYERFIGEKVFNGRQPYGTTTQKVIWQSEGILTNDATYMGTNTNGFQNAMPEAYGVYSFATGCGSAATGNYSTVFGAGATAKAGGAQAFGVSALAGGIASVAMGVGSEAAGKSAVAIGGLANALGENSIALGTKVKAAQSYAIAIGTDAEARASGSIAIGSRRSNRTEENKPNREVLAEAENSIAIGTFAYAKTEDSVALGVNAQVFSKDGVAIGGGSVSRREKGAEAYDPATDTVSSEKSGLAWKSTAGVFSIGEVNADGNDGKGELTRQITGVAAGKEDTDAVNVAQLKALRGIIGKGGGGGWKISANNTGPTDVNVGNTVDFSVIKSNVGPDNLKITKSNENDNHKIQFTLADELKLTKVTTGQSSMSDDGFIIGNDGPKMVLDGFFVNGQNGPSMTQEGIDAGNKKITNVAEAENDTDAVNFEQLKKFTEGIKGGGWKLSVEDGKATDITAGSTVRFFAVSNNYTGQKNIKIANTNGQNVSFDLANNINVESVTAGESIMDASGFRFEGDDGTEGPSITVNGIYAGDKTITGVATGEQDTDAVNFGQLKKYVEKNGGSWKLSVDGNNATDVKVGSTVDLVAAEGDGGYKNITIEKSNGNEVTFALNDNLKLTSVTTGNSLMNDQGFSFVDGDGPKITLNGIEAGNKKITKVADGAEPNDAVNYKQLTEIKTLAENGWQLSVDGKNPTGVKAGSTVDLVTAEGDGGHKNITIEKSNENKVTFTLNDKLKLTNVTTGNSIMDGSGFGFVDAGPKITVNGINAGDKKITGVAKGEGNTDAVNFSQLKEMKDQIASDSLVKWDERQNLITIGGEKDGIEINVANNEDENRIISGVAVGKVSADSTEAINGHQLFNYAANISEYFGGETDVIDGFKPTFTIQDNEYHNVTDAFGGLDDYITDIYTQINNVTESSLVKWDEGEGLITIGKEKSGTKIDIKGTEGERTIAGVKDGDLGKDSKEAVNGSQINAISGDIAKYFGGGASFENGVFKRPRYNLTTIDSNGEVKQKEHNDVGSALSGLDTNIRNVNHHFINAMNDIANYFGGGAGYDKNGEWHAPTFQVYHINDNGTVSKKPHQNVADAFEDVNNTFTNIHNQISNIKENNLVQQEEEFGLITIGAKTGGTEISIENMNGEERTLFGVKDGEISRTSTEAVNGSQIFKIAKNISNYFGGSTDVYEGIKPAFLIDGETYHNVTDAFTGVNVSITNIDNKISEMKENSLVKWDEGQQLITIGKDKAGTEINIAGYGNAPRKISRVREAENDDEAVNKAQLDKSIKGISKDALLWDDNEEAFVALHEKNGEKTKSKLKYLLDGDISKNSTDAINGSQLYSISNQLANYFGGDAKYENGKWTAPTFKIVQVDVNGKTIENSYNTVAEAFGGINSGMSNINNRIDDVINKVDSDALKWNSNKNAYDASRDGKPSKIINVADGRIEKGSKDAVNGGQLWQTNERVAKVENRVTDVENHVEIIDKKVDNISNTIEDIGDTVNNINIKVDNIDNKVNDIAEDAVRYDRDENGNKTNKITLAGGDASEPVVIDNVADGKIEKGSKEAVNGGQLHDYTQEQMKIVLDESKQYTDQKINNIRIDAIDEAVDKSKNYTDMKFDALNYSIENVKKEARQAAAIGLAVSNLRYNDTPGKLSVGFGTGLWRSQSAFAFGAGYTSENGNIRSNVSVTTSGGHWGVGAGFNMTLN